MLSRTIWPLSKNAQPANALLYSDNLDSMARPELVDHSYIDNQVLYKLTICQLGLCAFRHGSIREAHQGLSRIQNTHSAKELFAQAFGSRQHETQPNKRRSIVPAWFLITCTSMSNLWNVSF
ncbi:hypothetical protein GCK72_026282 [Caenorhabditis remanei]|uniref:Eukaryotic translation initiation factor 3 subunit C N-terminal domain-containing protein n=1 Tax=Caenorhabditis remanei TaxID=31234 RepID=A0A6A5G4T2_CAERE|nr:hypothetical protein GCK72_026282 [Caenorhabditis remanei]KAF1749813.1 hypothetical protein GCK72_026282 [Caenorhabditis remanei]